MSATCPNCKNSVSRVRLFFTTAWGRFECESCGSVLGVNTARRLALVIPISLSPLLATPMARWAGITIGVLVLIGVAVGSFALIFALDQPKLYERRGLRCPECGYTLHGLPEDRCPECGLTFNLAELQDKVVATDDSMASKSKWASFVTALIVGLLLLTVLSGLYVYRKKRAQLLAPPGAVAPANVQPPANAGSQPAAEVGLEGD